MGKGKIVQDIEDARRLTTAENRNVRDLDILKWGKGYEK